MADLETGERGSCNYSWGLPFVEELDTSAGAEKLLKMLQTGEASHSRRNRPMKLTEPETAQLKALVS